MADSTLNRFLARGTNAARIAFTPSPPTPSSGPSPTYIWYATDTANTYAWDGAAWQQVNNASGSVTTTGSPANGNLTKFSAAGTITNGDLSGDVTTTGTLATTIANNAVTTAKILNANVTLAKIANAAANSKLLGSGASGSGSAYAELTLGSNLSMSGTTLNAAGGGWQLAGTGQTATGVWDFAVDGAKTNIDFSGLSAFTEFMIVGRAVTRTNSTVSAVRVSVAATFYSASGDYVSEGATGVNTNVDWFGSHSTNATAARDFFVHIRPSVSGGGAIYSTSTDGLVRKFVASTGAIDALRCFAYSGGTTTGGKIYCYAR